MKTKLKRCFSVMLTVAMLFTSIPVHAFEELSGEIFVDGEISETEVMETESSEPELEIEPSGFDGSEVEFNSGYLFSDGSELVSPETEFVGSESQTGEMTDEPNENTEAEAEGEEDGVSIDLSDLAELVMPVQEEMDAILVKYLGKTVMSREEIEEIVIYNMGWDEYEAALGEIEHLEAAIMEIGEVGYNQLNKESLTTMGVFVELLELSTTPMFFAAKTVSVLDGNVSITDSGGTGKVSNGTVTVTAKGSLFSTKTNNITITNESGKMAQLSFNYKADKSNSFKIAGVSASASGTYTVMLDAGKTVAIQIVSNSGLSNTTATLTLSAFSLVEAAEASDITFEYDKNYGNITAVDETDTINIEAGSTHTVSLSGMEVTATAINGGRFLGWVNAEDGSILSVNPVYDLEPASNMTVKAMFVGAGSAPHFMLGPASQKTQSVGLLGLSKRAYYTVGGTHLFDDLNTAVAQAANSDSKVLVLMNDSTLPAGDYTIPSGITLLIPFDSDNTMFTTECVSVSSYTSPTAYRTLTLADGAKLTINGSMSVSAKHTSAQGSKDFGGAPTGDVAFVKMKGNSNITVKNGGALYAYGFITGSGSVVAKEGATVYELFQCTDFRGGSQSTDMDNGVFPLSQYYVQNIEVPMTLESGAKEYSYTTITMSSSDFGSAVGFIGPSGSMFNLTDGYVVKKYDGNSDRLVVTVNGDISLSGINMSVGTSSINSKNYDLPINSNITVEVNSGTINIGQDIAILPGAKILIGENAKCNLASGMNVYVYDADEWGTYAGAVNKPFIPVKYAPGGTYTRTEADLVDAEILVNGHMDASAGYVYTTTGGANIYSTNAGEAKIRPGSQKVTYQLIQGTGYVEIPLTSAKLVNNVDGNKTYVDTSKMDIGTWKYGSGVWNGICSHRSRTNKVTTEATCEIPGVKTYTCNCGDTYTEEIPATGHTVVVDEAVEATCEGTGLTEGSHCSVCDVVLVSQEEIPATGHTVVVDEAVEATCEGTGLTEGSHCSVCTKVLVSQEEIPATGHTKVVDEAVESTCEETGLTEGSHCSACPKVFVSQEVIPAKGHEWGEKAIITEATCEAEGKTTCKCKACDEEKEEVVPALGHDLVVEDEKAPTCTAPGYNAGSHCLRCNYTEGMTAIPETGHTYNDGEIITPSDCLNDGEIKYTCGSCGDTYTEEIEATGHTVVVDEAVEPTCEETGLTEGSHCSACPKVFVSQEVIPALGHNMVDATCTAPKKCDNEGCTVTEGEPLGHTEVIDEEIPAFCEDTGLTEGSHCSVCNEVLIEQQEIEALGHDIHQHEAKQPTFTNVGWEAYEDCSRCAYTTYVEIPSLPSPTISSYEEFVTNLRYLEEMAVVYSKEVPGKDPVALVIKYIRTGVDRYNSGSWGIMAGYEDAEFAAYVSAAEDEINAVVEDESQMIKVSGLKNIEDFVLPNGDKVDFGHMFGTMDITHHNKGSLNHADVGGWAGDIVDLLEIADNKRVTGAFEEMVAEISEKYLCKSLGMNEGLGLSSFSLADMYGDLDAYYIMQTLHSNSYYQGMISDIVENYFTENLDDEDRAAFFLNNRLNGISTRNALRETVYKAYTGNKVIATLEGTRELTASNLSELRKASCYAFADYICRLAGDFVEVTDNPYYTVFSSTTSNLAPGITQEIHYATSADNKQMVYYLATADLTRDDVHVYANYKNNDPTSWGMSRVLDQANAAQKKYGDPESEYYIPNYNVIASINGDGYNMSTGEPGGLLVMNGIEYHPINSNGFFAILKNGQPIIGTTAEYEQYKDQVQDAIGAFGTTLVKNGEITITATSNYYSSRASRTSVGITKTGKVVFMVLDGRQEPFSCGGSMIEIAQIMQEAGCIHAVNLDGGGSTTFVAKQEGEEDLSVVNSPSDGAARSVSTSLMMVSTAPSSTAFDHANLEAESEYMTVGSSIQITPVGVSATGNVAEIPEGTTWKVSDERWGTITEDGVLTALRNNGSIEVYLMLGDDVIGSKTINIVSPQKVYFTKDNINVVYGQTIQLPVKALYEGNEVVINTNDVTFEVGNDAAGYMQGFYFISNDSSGIKNVKITAALVEAPDVTASMMISLFNQGEVSFDFDKSTGGDRLLAWDRQVSNSTTEDGHTYVSIDKDEKMITSYSFAMDMSQIPIPKHLEDLTFMLPGADMEGASAWTFLLQLAERVSVLTEVKPVLRFDSNFDVDYSELKIINEYFELNGTEFNEETNTLTLTLNWKDQTKAIDPEVANPLCIVNGIKLTPKDEANWDAKSRLNALHSGEISYKMYLRANALYSFALKHENQKTYGILPFVNPNDENEKGGYLSSIYKEFEDTYTLENSVKEGWVTEDGGFAYYENGERYTGIHQIDGYYYDFGDDGICAGQTKYTGLLKDDDSLMYSLLGVLQTGWHIVNDNYYYFEPSTYAAKMNGTYLIDRFKYTFDENGVHTKGQLVRVIDENETIQTKYMFAGRYVVGRFSVIDGKTYWFNKGTGYMAKGDQILKTEVGQRGKLYKISAAGVVEGVINYTGSYTCADGTVYGVINGVPVTYGLYEFNGETYFCNHYEGILATGKVYVDDAYVTEDVVKGWHYFDETGRMYHNEFYEYGGNLYYMVYGAPGKVGLFEIDGERYYAVWNGVVQTGKVYITSGVDELSGKGWYYFDESGAMYHEEFATVDGKVYYMVDGQPKIETGVIEKDGFLYCSQWNGSYKIGKIYVTANEAKDIVSEGWYYTDESGRFYHNEFVTIDGNVYYMVMGQPRKDNGVHEIDGELYCFEWNGIVRTGKIYITESSSNGLLTAGYYYTDEGGRFYHNELVTIDGSVYYMVMGQPKKDNGVHEIDGELYCFEWNGVVRTGKIYVTDSSSNNIVSEGWYYTDETGKFYNNLFLEIEGKQYYMVKGQPRKQNGVAWIDGELYCFEWNGVLRTGKIYVTASSSNGIISEGWYYTDEAGRFYNEEFLTIDGNLYYMYRGQPRKDNGVQVIDDSLYCFEWNGVIRTGKIYITESSANGMLSEGWYYTDELGKFYSDEFRNLDGKTYYMLDGKPAQYSGVVEIDNKFYCFEWNGSLRIGKIYITASSTNGIVNEGWCYTDETGRLYDEEFVEIDGSLYYLQNGSIAKLGVFEIDEKLYYADTWNGKLARDEKVYISVESTNDLIIWGYHTFDINGKMIS